MEQEIPVQSAEEKAAARKAAIQRQAAMQRQAAAQRQAVPPVKPKRKTGKRVLLVLLILLLLLGCAGVVCYSLGVLDPLLPMAGMEPVGLQYRKDRLAALEEDYTKREQKLARREAAVEKQAAELALREAAVAEQEQAQLSFADVLATASEEQLEALRKTSAICSGMETDSAVRVVQAMASAEEMALVLYYMPEDKAAELMAKLPANTAAKVLSLIIR